MMRFITVVDTPGIKQFVFGTDALAEIRGASALLDRLNREDTEQILGEALGSKNIQKVFANGGTGQFIVHAPDRKHVQKALDQLAQYYSQQTGGEMRLIAGFAEWPANSGTSYQQAVQTAFRHIQWQRQMGRGYATVATFPLVVECESTSYLPASGPYRWGGEQQLILSEASQLKREASREARRGMLWLGWLESLDANGAFVENNYDLRCKDAVTIGEYSRGRWRGYIGLIYADGNAMGRLVQELDSPEVCRAFSELVDGSIRDACYEALSKVCQAEIRQAKEDIADGIRPQQLPADILLLGGDDLLVLLPADRALSFTLVVTEAFERLTRDRQTHQPPEVQKFFAKRDLGQRGLTISCGVAIAPSRYPFYLMLDLAEELLKSAKRGGSEDSSKTPYWSPSYVDFHVLSGSASQELAAIREHDYLVSSPVARTLRPYSRDRLQKLYLAAQRLREARLPRSKLQDLFEAALEPRSQQAQRYAEELFGRLRESPNRRERSTLWHALTMLGPLTPYPWTTTPDGKKKVTALADLIEAHELIEQSEEQ
jgi:hypothetical protein